jgi:hypothetical protein
MVTCCFLKMPKKHLTVFTMFWPFRIWVRMWWNLFWLFQNLANFLPRKKMCRQFFFNFTFAQYFIQEKDGLHQCWEGKCSYTYTHHVELGQIFDIYTISLPIVCFFFLHLHFQSLMQICLWQGKCKWTRFWKRKKSAPPGLFSLQASKGGI